MNCLDEIQPYFEEQANDDLSMVETEHNEGTDNNENNADDGQNNENNPDDGQKWWDSESQNLLDSQQLVDALSLCDDLLRSQSPTRDGKDGEQKNQPSLSIYAQLGPEHLKKDIEDCQNLVLEPSNVESNVENDTPSELRLSQLVFPCSQ